MTTARIRHLQKILIEKYGVIGRVASRYLGAGYSLELMHPTRYGPIHIIARGGGGQIFAIEVISKPDDTNLETVKSFLEKAKLVRAKPILVLYSDGIKLPEEVYKFCIENGIKVKRVKPGE